ncbi:MAG: ABC transporter permease [Candidatus Izemoplasmatales bacterium]|jgi:sodium transport system permease protein|nr:ABC transporter permease [Candidatus Izemoplasmatales bacterium]
MKNILTIFKKEWDRVIKDKRLVITVMLLPGLMIFMIYSFIGVAIDNMYNGTITNIAIVNPTQEFTDIYQASEDSSILNVIAINPSEVSDFTSKIDSGEWDLVIIFSDNINTYDGNGDKPTVNIYSNPNEMNSSSASSRFITYLSQYQQMLSFDFYGDTSFFNFVLDGTPIDSNQITGSLISSMLPMLVIMFLFSGAMSIGPESIAGEKERNTISTLLITPVKRSEIALGKILSLSVLSLLSAISSFIGILFSLPKLLNLDDASAAIYTVSDYLMILFLLFSTVFVIVGVISILSAFSKSVKEATTLIMPFYIITILVSITSMFSSNAQTNYVMYLIPIYNTVQSMSAILSFDSNSIYYLIISIVANLGYLTLFVFILNRMFNSEKIMFSK